VNVQYGCYNTYQLNLVLQSGIKRLELVWTANNNWLPPHSKHTATASQRPTVWYCSSRWPPFIENRATRNYTVRAERTVMSVKTCGTYIYHCKTKLMFRHHDMKQILKKLCMVTWQLDSPPSAQSPVARSCEYGNESCISAFQDGRSCMDVVRLLSPRLTGRQNDCTVYRG
jgi:hypothetical protein